MRCCIIPIAAHRPTRLRRTGTIPSTASIFLTQRGREKRHTARDSARPAGWAAWRAGGRELRARRNDGLPAAADLQSKAGMPGRLFEQRGLKPRPASHNRS